MKTTHQLSIQLAKKLFVEKSGLVIHLLENTLTTEAIAAKLTPLLIYAINIEGVPGRFVQFAPMDKPLSLTSFLRKAWGEEGKEGMPNVLKISKTLYEHFPWIDDFANQLNIEVVVSDGKDRAFTANQLAVQGVATDRHYSNSPRGEDHKKISLPTVADMNKPGYFQDGWIYPFSGVSSIEQKSIDEYRLQPKKYINANPGFDTAWDAFPSECGWLMNVQKSIAPRSLQTIKNEIALALGKINYNEFCMVEESDEDNILDANHSVKQLLNCWPQSKTMVAKKIGITLQSLEWYLSGKKGLDEAAFYNLCDYMKIYASPNYQYEDGSPVYEIEGNYLLQADKLAQADDIFSELTGYDHTYKVEVLPDNDRPDPSFRFLLFGRHLDFHIMVLNRSSTAASFIDNKDSRSGSVVIPTKMYRDILRLFGETSNGNINPADFKEHMVSWFNEIEKINNQFDAHYY